VGVTGREDAVRVVIVDDHAVFAQALASVLADQDGMTAVGTAYSVADGIALIEEVAPDVAVVDYRLRDGRGSDLVRTLHGSARDVRVVILTAAEDEAAFLDALDAGCAGYVTKDRPLEEVVAAVTAAASGDVAVAPALLARTLSRLGREIPRARLTVREREVLELVAEGLSNKAIAAALSLRLNTVRNHVQNILTKLDAHSKLEAVAIATREGLIRSAPYGG
jgi:two-component system nitrate/nitrite response regulator NarL